MRFENRGIAALAALCAATSIAFGAAGETWGEDFKKIQISADYYAEGAGAGDFNRDGVMDIVCGPFWYAGPDYQTKHQFYDGHPFPNDTGYSDNFFSFAYDVNSDGWTDVVTIGFPGRAAHWYENPQGAAGDWNKHVALAGVGNESPTFADLTGDGRPEIVGSFQQRLGYAEIDPANPTAPWTFHAITDPGPWRPFTHGLGLGDVNGDGRTDVLTATGWFEQPESLEGDPLWEPHPFKFCQGGAQMFAYDVDADGDNDVITSLQAHAYGLSWFEQIPSGDGGITFKEHKLMGEKPDENPFGVAFSQLHAMALEDMNGDGLKDIVTGKCYWAHNGHDPGARDPAVLYIFQLTRTGDAVEFVPVQVDDNSGVGRQVTIADLNGDERPDIVVANKKGIFAFQQTDGEDTASANWPEIEEVEVQPLLAQIKRLQDALEFVGSPLPAEAREALGKLAGDMSKADVARGVQEALDPLCLAGIRIDDSEGKIDVAVTAGPAQPELYEQGWRTFLVKVVNDAEVRGSLEVASPSARSLPGSPPDQVDDRWLDVSMYDGRPLKPSLSGLELEYRIIQVYSTGVGRRRAMLRFGLTGLATGEDAGEAPLVHEWTFEDGADGWKAERHCEVTAADGVLRITATGNDPGISVPVESGEGPHEFRVWMTSSGSGFAQVFWRTEDEDGFVFKRSAVFQVQAGDKPEHVIRLPVEGRLTGLRFDPLHRPGDFEIDWIRLSAAGAGVTPSDALAVNFETVPSTPITFNVLDESGEPCLAAFVIRDALGRVYPAPSKRLAPDFFFHPQVYRGLGETVRLPTGEYTIECNRGPESIPEMKSLTVGEEPVNFVYRVQRWIDPAQFGWWSGDHHIHAAGCMHYTNPTEGVHPPDMARHIMGEDLKVGCNLTWGPCFDYQKQFFTGKVDPVSQYPYLLRYDIEVSGFGSHVSGHLCLLRLRDQMYPGGDSSDHWPTLGLNTLKWAKAQGAITGPAHSAAGLAPSQEKVEGKDGPPLPGWVHNVALPNHFIPQYNGIGANEFVVDITHNVPGPDGELVPAVDFISTMDTDRVVEWNMWYHTLNCGFRVRASGETDFPCISGDRVGMGRVYVKVQDKLDYDEWCEGIRLGRSYVSDGTGHLIDFRAEIADDPKQAVELGEENSELTLAAPANVRLTVKAAVRREGTDALPVEVIVNSYPVDQRMIPADGSLHDLEFDVPIDRSSWVAVRVSGSAHTNPIFVLVDGKPIRASASSAEWLLKGVDQCWKNKQKTYAEAEQADARAAYDHARQVYRQILDESRTGG